jgi:hypothetical protein
MRLAASLRSASRQRNDAQHVRERLSLCLTSVSYEPGDDAGFGWVAARSGMGFTTVASWL